MKQDLYVYLGGPITGISYSAATEWREMASSYFKVYKVKSISPLRFKHHLSGEEILQDRYEHILSTPKAITRRDYFDVIRCDLLFVNLCNAIKVSIGTVMEIAWAYERRIPMVIVMEEGNIHTHAMVDECADFTVQTMEEGLKLATDILLPE